MKFLTGSDTAVCFLGTHTIISGTEENVTSPFATQIRFSFLGELLVSFHLRKDTSSAVKAVSENEQQTAVRTPAELEINEGVINRTFLSLGMV